MNKTMKESNKLAWEKRTICEKNYEKYKEFINEILRKKEKEEKEKKKKYYQELRHEIVAKKWKGFTNETW